MALPARPPSLRLLTPQQDVSGLTGVQSELIPPGAICQVIGEQAIYEWRDDSTDPADGVTVVANAKGASFPGRWHRLTNDAVELWCEIGGNGPTVVRYRRNGGKSISYGSIAVADSFGGTALHVLGDGALCVSSWLEKVWFNKRPTWAL